MCGAVKSGIMEFSETGFKVMTGDGNNYVHKKCFEFSGCTNHPAPGEWFCKFHQNHKSPVLTPNQISKESLASLNSQQSNREKFLMTGLDRDNIFVVEG